MECHTEATGTPRESDLLYCDSDTYSTSVLLCTPTGGIGLQVHPATEEGEGIQGAPVQGVEDQEVLTSKPFEHNYPYCVCNKVIQYHCYCVYTVADTDQGLSPVPGLGHALGHLPLATAGGEDTGTTGMLSPDHALAPFPGEGCNHS